MLRHYDKGRRVRRRYLLRMLFWYAGDALFRARIRLDRFWDLAAEPLTLAIGLSAWVPIVIGVPLGGSSFHALRQPNVVGPFSPHSEMLRRRRRALRASRWPMSPSVALCRRRAIADLSV